MGSTGAVGGRLTVVVHIEYPSANSAATMGGIYEISPPAISASPSDVHWIASAHLGNVA
jgi:hypothetical protein